MDFGLAAASLIIAVFTFFIIWGRSASGQQLLVRVFGPAPRPARRTRRRTTSTATRKRQTSTKSGSTRTRRTTKK